MHRKTLFVLALFIMGPALVYAQPADSTVQAPPVPPAPDEISEMPVAERRAPRSVRSEAVIDVPAGQATHGDISFADPAWGILMEPKAEWPGIRASLADSATGTTFSIFNPSERLFFVRGDGRVGMGLTNPTARLHVNNVVDALTSLQAGTASVVEADATQGDTAAFVLSYQNVESGVTNSGSSLGLRSRGYLYGDGTLSASYGAIIESGVHPSVAGTVTRAEGVRVIVGTGGGVVNTGYGLYVDVRANDAYGVYQFGAGDRNVFQGKLYVGAEDPDPARAAAFYVKGSAHFTETVTGGNIKAKYQDVAEWVPATHDLTPGTVVVLNPERDNEVMPSSSSYDTTVAGVVSAQPGISLGEEAEGSEQIATTGRVKVRVDATRAPIRIGDLLVTSDVPGMAMRSEPTDFNGRRFHQPGTIIGKALQPLAGGVGEILVLLSMQ